MAKMKRKIDTGMEKQMSIFDMLEDIETKKTQGPAPGSLNMGAQIKNALTAALKGAGLKRWEIAGRMSDYISTEITESMLNSWTADSKEGHRFPLEYIAAFCWATGDYTVIKMVAQGCGCHLTMGREVVLLQMARLSDMRRRIDREEEKMLAYLDKMESRITTSTESVHPKGRDGNGSDRIDRGCGCGA